MTPAKFTNEDINEYLSLSLPELYKKLEELSITDSALKGIDFEIQAPLSGDPIPKPISIGKRNKKTTITNTVDIILTEKTPHVSGKIIFIKLKKDIQNLICNNEIVLAYIDKENDSKVNIAQCLIALLGTSFSPGVSIVLVSIIIREGIKIFCSTKNSKSIFAS